MSSLTGKLNKLEFEARIFVSFGIVIFGSMLSLFTFSVIPPNFILLAKWWRLEATIALRMDYLFIAFIMTIASLIRMWAGSILTSSRMMSFTIRKKGLITGGPYHLVRNPIYLADLIAFCGFALCLNPVGFLLPVLLFIHYTRLIKYEEASLSKENIYEFSDYEKTVPRFLPRFNTLSHHRSPLEAFYINADGFRHNALYLLFIPGFIVAAITGSLISGIFIGLPAVIDWACIHTRKGLNSAQSIRGGQNV